MFKHILRGILIIGTMVLLIVSLVLSYLGVPVMKELNQFINTLVILSVVIEWDQLKRAHR